MKSKTLTYTLILSVGALWGFIFYKIYQTTASDDGPILVQSGVSITKEFDVVPRQANYTLALNYRDPFLDEAFVPPVPPKVITRQINIPAPPPPPPPINWDFFAYKGSITNAKTNTRVSIVSVYNKEQMISDGESVAGVKIIKNYGDSIQVLYQGKTKFILLK